jgi:hypothetical protein
MFLWLSRELFVLSADLVKKKCSSGYRENYSCCLQIWLKKKRASGYRENYSCCPQIWLKRNVPLVIIGIIRVVHRFG